MALPAIKRIIQEDFPDQKTWIGKLIEPLNKALISISSLLNKGLTFEDNFKAQVKSLNFVYNTTNLPLYFSSTIKGRPNGLFVINIVENNVAQVTAFSNAVFPTWEYLQDGRIKILDVTGLNNNSEYTMTMVVL